MSLLSEFRTFIQRGNVIDLAVAVIIGAAFGKIVTSLVTDILLPVIGIATQGINVSELRYDLMNPVDPTQVLVTLKYGNFLQASIDFIIVAICVFLLVKAMNKLQSLGTKKDAADAPQPLEPTPQEKLLMEIRDLLKAKLES